MSPVYIITASLMTTCITRTGFILGRASSSRLVSIPLKASTRSYASTSASQSWDAKPVDLSYDLVEPAKPNAESKGQSLVICHGLLYVPQVKKLWGEEADL
jgi:hypothetical protein